MKDIYELKLHEGVTIDCGINIMRVPGGWIYDGWDIENDKAKQGTFVPFNKEFAPKKAKAPVQTKINDIPTFEEFKEHALSKEHNISLKNLKLKYDSWVENGWADGHGNKIKQWKGKLTNTIQYLPKNDNTISDKKNINQKWKE